MQPFTKMGLTGGIASGKSEVGRLLTKHGITVVDMDILGRTFLESDPEVKKAVVDVMGEEVITQGVLDRAKLRKIIFSDPTKKKQLENIIHPRVRKEFELLAKDEAKKGKSLIVCEAALLIESGYRSALDKLTVVLAPIEIRLQRLLERDSISPELAKEMMKSQVSDEQRATLANYVIPNSGDRKMLENQVEILLRKWKSDGIL